SAAEMAAKGELGIEIEVDKVPRRESGMEPFEVMISESQERMLAVVEPDKVDEVLKLAERYELVGAVVGRVAGHGDLRVLQDGEVVGTVPAGILADAPAYERKVSRPDYLDGIPALDLDFGKLPPPDDYKATLLKMLSHPNLCSRRSIWEQYDHEVGTNTVVPPGADAAVMRIKGTKRGFAITTDGRGRHCYLDPRGGGAATVAEAYRNLSCVGAEPVALTDCLNFGSPEKKAPYYQLAECIEGMSGACEAFGTPVVSGNVSLYNETADGAIYPTPTVGMVGVLGDVTRHATSGFKREGDVILTVGDFRPALDGSEYLEIIHGEVAGLPRRPDLDAEKRVADAVRRAIEEGMLDTAHDLSGGGLAVALVKMALSGGFGAEVQLLPGGRQDVSLFGETGGCTIVAVPGERLEVLEAALGDVPHNKVGRVGGDRLKVAGVEVKLSELREAYERDLFS
ncbi:MAG: AIR synthase-related protein, partial [Rubrobacteraceae bacterium]